VVLKIEFGKIIKERSMEAGYRDLLVDKGLSATEL